MLRFELSLLFSICARKIDMGMGSLGLLGNKFNMGTIVIDCINEEFLFKIINYNYNSMGVSEDGASF